MKSPTQFSASSSILQFTEDHVRASFVPDPGCGLMEAHLRNARSVLGPGKSDQVRKDSENVDIFKGTAEGEKEQWHLHPHMTLTQAGGEEGFLSSSGCEQG